VLEAAMKARNAAEVETLLCDFQRRSPARPLLDRELIRLDSDSLSKEEVIREAIDAFYAAGRTEDPQQVEEAVWAREEVYSTGVGFGFAIPHCKTDALATNSIGVVRLRQAIEWWSVDGQPVQMVILMAIRESDKNDAHMRVLAQLARKLMHEDFRARLLAAPDRDAVAEYLTAELGLAQADARA
jgi:fructose-specific PTS system IIA-like component